MSVVEAFAVAISVANGALVFSNGAIALVRPIARIHARIDVLEDRFKHLIAIVERIENRQYNQINDDDG